MKTKNSRFPALGFAALAMLSTLHPQRYTCFGQTQNLFVSDAGNNAIYQFTPDGTRSTFASGLNSPDCLAFDCSGNLFVSDTHAVRKFAPNGTNSVFADLGYWSSGLAFDSAGNLFAGSADGMVWKFRPDGTGGIFTNGPVADAMGVALDGADNLYVADYAMGTVDEFTMAGAETNFGVMYRPYGLAFDRAGNLFVSDSWSGNAIYKFPPGGPQTLFASLPGEVPMGLAFDSAGNLFVACYGSGKIYKYTTNGVQSTFASGLSTPTDLAFQPAPAIGNVCVFGDGLRFDTAGGRMNAPCLVLASTNLALPLSRWTPVATNQFDPCGHFSFTNSMNARGQFYILQSP